MTTFTERRIAHVTLTLLAAAVIIALVAWGEPTARDAAYTSGWVLMGLMVFLTIYNLRKKMPYPPLFSSAAWLQLHVYIGWLTIPVYLLHTAVRLPTGPMDITLAALFVLLIASGIFGLLISRSAPRRMTVRGQEVIFERIPMIRRQLRQRVEQVVLEAVKETDTTTLSAFYRDRLADFFSRPRHMKRHLLQWTGPRQRLLREVASLRRYLDDREQAAADEIEQLIEDKDALDYHHAMQWLLKAWLFVHLPLTYALMILAVVHAVLMHTFVGVIR